MAIYLNHNAKSIFRKVECSDAKAGEPSLAVFTLSHEMDKEAALSALQHNQYKVMGHTVQNGSPIIVVQLNDTPEKALKNFTYPDSAQIEDFALEQKKSKGLLGFLEKYGWKVRGGTSVVAQGLQLFSAATAWSPKDIEKGPAILKVISAKNIL